MVYLAILLALAGNPRTASRARGGPHNYNLGEPRADIVSNIWASYDLTGNPDAGFVDSGPNALTVPVAFNAQGYPKLETVDGVLATRFTRANTSGSPAVSDNYGKLASVDNTLYNTMVGVPFSISFWWKRVASSESTGPERVIDLGCAGGSNSGTDASQSISRVTNNFRPNWTGPIGNANSYTGTTVIPYNQWNHWVIVEETRPSSKMRFKFYLNGVLVETSADQTNQPGHWSAAPSGSTCSIAISNAFTGTAQGQIGGYLRLLKVYARSLSALDIKALYDNGG